MEETTTNPPSVLSTGVKFGLIIAAVSIAWFIIQVVIGINPFVRDWKGWLSMAVSIAIVVFAHKSFKDSGDGYMSYGQGLGIAFIAIMVSVLVGSIFSYIYINFIDQTVMDEVWEKALEEAQSKGQNEEAAQMGIEWGKKLFWVFYLVGGAFVALIIGLLVPIFTQKKNPEPFV
jgi:hypothetical protein